MQQKISLELPWATLWRVFLMGLVVIGLYAGREIAVLLLLAIIVSSALEGPVEWLEAHRVPRILGTMAVFGLGITAFVFAAYIIVPVVALEFSIFAKSIGARQLAALGGVGEIVQLIWSEVVPKEFTAASVQKIFETILREGSSIVATGKGIIDGVIKGISALAIAFYLTITKDGVGKFLRAVFPDASEGYIVNVYEESRKKIGRWMQTQLLLSVIVGLVVFLGLWAIGVEYALVIGLLAGLFEIVPIVGPVLAGVIGVLSALTTSGPLALTTLLFFFGVQQLENHLLVPLLMRHAVDLHPVLVIISILVGYEVGGIVGMAVAVPVMVVMSQIIEDRARRKGVGS